MTNLVSQPNPMEDIGSVVPINGLESARLEKAAQDAGFDRSIEQNTR